MTSDSDDLEQQLRENSKLRRDLAAEVAKAKDGKQARCVRLGWVLYWACIVLIGVWVFGMVALLATTQDTIPDMVGEVMREPLAHLIWFGLPAIALYGLCGGVYRGTPADRSAAEDGILAHRAPYTSSRRHTPDADLFCLCGFRGLHEGTLMLLRFGPTLAHHPG